MKKFLSLCLIALGIPLGLTGCSDGAHEDLQMYMQEVRRRPARPIEPIPTFTEYQTFTYSAAGVRSPFEAPIEVEFVVIDGQQLAAGDETIAPDPTRIKEYLESFSISSISMVGTISRENEFWALVDDGTGNVHRVKEGNFMGRNHGRIVQVSNIQVSLVEIVPDGLDGWVERPRALKLIEAE